jgi:hypothetical protein
MRLRLAFSACSARVSNSFVPAPSGPLSPDCLLQRLSLHIHVPIVEDVLIEPPKTTGGYCRQGRFVGKPAPSPLQVAMSFNQILGTHDS